PPPDTGVGVPAVLGVLWVLPDGLGGWLLLCVPLLALAALALVERARPATAAGSLPWMAPARLGFVVVAVVMALGIGSRSVVEAANRGASPRSNPIAASAESVARGRLIFLANCATCHADDGSGQGPQAAGMPPAPGASGAGLAVAAAFLVSATVVKVGTDAPRYPRLRIPLLPSLVLGWLLAAVGMIWWYGAIVAAFAIGAETPIPAIGLWIFVWAALPIAAELLGNAWPALSPFRTTFALLERLARLLGFDRLDLGLVYPSRAARWPAVLLLLAGV